MEYMIQYISYLRMLQFHDLINDSEVSIYNALGEIVYHKKLIQTQSIVLPTEHLNSGIYSMQIKTENKSFSQKIIKQ